MKSKKLIGICVTVVILTVVLAVHIVGGNMLDMMKAHMGL